VNRHERLVQNQDRFRYANERLQERLSGAGVTDHRHVPFFCECADEMCLGRIRATLDEFDEAHAGSQHYFLLPGHSTVYGEEAVETNGRYDVMTKEAA
jgi:hypothetical protein